MAMPVCHTLSYTLRLSDTTGVRVHCRQTLSDGFQTLRCVNNNYARSGIFYFGATTFVNHFLLDENQAPHCGLHDFGNSGDVAKACRHA